MSFSGLPLPEKRQNYRSSGTLISGLRSIGHYFRITVIPSGLLSILPYYCHSFRISVIPSRLLSFLPDYCHSFQIIVIPSRLVSFLPNIVIPSNLLPFQIFVILNSSGTLPYTKGEKNGHRRWPYMRVYSKLKDGIL